MSFYGTYPPIGNSSGIPTYANLAAFPAANSVPDGSLAIALDTHNLYESNGATWLLIGGPSVPLSVGTIDAQTPASNGAVLTSNQLFMQSASVTVPGLVNNTTQSFSGNKTFTGTIAASNLAGTNTGDVTLGTANGLSLAAQALSLALSSGSTTGALSSTDWTTFNSKGSGSVTSIAMSVPAFLSIAGSPITTSGTLALTLSGTALPVANGGTGLTSGNAGDIPYFSGTTTISTINYAARTILAGQGGGSPPSGITGLAYQVLRKGAGDATDPVFGAIDLSQSAAVTGILRNANTSADSANTASAIVARDSSGNFAAGTITAALTGTASGNTTYSANNHGVVLSSATNAMTVLAPNASTAFPLISGGSSAGPSWAALTIAGGGTGQVTKAAAFDALSPMTTAGDIVYGGASGTGTRLAAGTTAQYLKGGTTPAWSAFTAPTVQRFISGSAATYTTPAGVLYIKVQMVGQGGGGGGTGPSNTAATGGQATTFGVTLSAGGGGLGVGSTGGGGGGGSNTATIGTVLVNVAGSAGQGSDNIVATGGGSGGTSYFGGAGSGSQVTTAGGSAATNSGSGGGGGGGGASIQGAGGGGSGGYLEVLITSPSATYTYTVGTTGGVAGGAGTGGVAGGTGGAGIIIVTEYYQ